MNNKILSIVGIAILIALAAWFIVDKGYFDNDRMKNAEMMKNGDATVIVTEDNVAYFAGAKGYFVRPEVDPPAGGYPGVVMIHENRGLRPEIRETAETLAKDGYMVLAVDLLGGVAEDQAGARALTSQFDQATGVANMRAATAYLRAQGAEKI